MANRTSGTCGAGPTAAPVPRREAQHSYGELAIAAAGLGDGTAIRRFALIAAEVATIISGSGRAMIKERI